MKECWILGYIFYWEVWNNAQNLMVKSKEGWGFRSWVKAKIIHAGLFYSDLFIRCFLKYLLTFRLSFFSKYLNTSCPHLIWTALLIQRGKLCSVWAHSRMEWQKSVLITFKDTDVLHMWLPNPTWPLFRDIKPHTKKSMLKCKHYQTGKLLRLLLFFCSFLPQVGIFWYASFQCMACLLAQQKKLFLIPRIV